MKQERTIRKSTAALFTATTVLVTCLGLTCPPGERGPYRILARTARRMAPHI